MSQSNKRNQALEVIEDCSGCGVCCLHMGYPAYMLPRPAATDNEIDTDPSLQALLATGWTREELLQGHPGESNWHALPSHLKQQWQQFVDSYKPQGALDGPCFWFDPASRRCKNHLYRPQVCRDFETGSRECRQWRAEYRDMVQH